MPLHRPESSYLAAFREMQTKQWKHFLQIILSMIRMLCAAITEKDTHAAVTVITMRRDTLAETMVMATATKKEAHAAAMVAAVMDTEAMTTAAVATVTDNIRK